MCRDWEKCIQGFDGEMKERDHFEDLGVYGSGVGGRGQF
jgi:hypothetical protein